jgi:hypothetical protein
MSNLTVRALNVRVIGRRTVMQAFCKKCHHNRDLNLTLLALISPVDALLFGDKFAGDAVKNVGVIVPVKLSCKMEDVAVKSSSR